MRKLQLQKFSDSIEENEVSKSCNFKSAQNSPPKQQFTYFSSKGGSMTNFKNSQKSNSLIKSKNYRIKQLSKSQFGFKQKEPPKNGPKNGKFFYSHMFDPPILSREQKEINQYTEEQNRIQREINRKNGIEESFEEPMDKTEFKEYMIKRFMNRKYNIKQENQLLNLKAGKRKAEKQFNKKMYFTPQDYEIQDFKAYLTQELQNISDISQYYNQNHVHDIKTKPIETAKYWNNQFSQSYLYEEYMYYYDKMKNQMNEEQDIALQGGGYSFKKIQQQFEAQWNKKLVDITSRLDPKELKSLYFVLQAGEAKSSMSKQALLDSAAQYLMERKMDIKQFQAKEIKEATQRMQFTFQEMNKLRQEKLQMSGLMDQALRKKSRSSIFAPQPRERVDSDMNKPIEAINEDEEEEDDDHENELIKNKGNKFQNEKKRFIRQISIQTLESDSESSEKQQEEKEKDQFGYLNLNSEDEIQINQRISMADIVGDHIKRLEEIGEIPHSPQYNERVKQAQKEKNIWKTIDENQQKKEQDIQLLRQRTQNKRKTCQEYVMAPIKPKKKLGINSIVKSEDTDTEQLQQLRNVVDETRKKAETEHKYQQVIQEQQEKFQKLQQQKKLNSRDSFSFSNVAQQRQSVFSIQSQQQQRSRSDSLASEDSQCNTPKLNQAVRNRISVQLLRKQSIQNMRNLTGLNQNKSTTQFTESKVLKQMNDHNKAKLKTEIDAEASNQQQLQKIINISQKQRLSQLRQSVQLKMSSINSLDNFMKQQKKHEFNDKLRDIILISTMEQYQDVFGANSMPSVVSQIDSDLSDEEEIDPIKKFEKEAIKRMSLKVNQRKSLQVKTEPNQTSNNFKYELDNTEINQQDLVDIVNNDAIENIENSTINLFEKLNFNSPNINNKLVQCLKGGYQQQKINRNYVKKPKQDDFIIRKCESILAKWDGKKYSTFNMNKNDIQEKYRKYQKDNKGFGKKAN